MKGLKISVASQKQAGDLVTITAGVNRGQEGVLQEKASKGWNIKLQTGEVVLASFPFIKLIAKKGEFEDGEPWKSILAGEVAEDKDAPNSPESPGTTSETTGDELKSNLRWTRHWRQQAPKETAGLKRVRKSRKILPR